MQEHLSHRHGGCFSLGELYRPTLGLDARARISERLGAEHFVDLFGLGFVSTMYAIQLVISSKRS